MLGASRRPDRVQSLRWCHVRWYAAGLLLGFGLPFALTDLLETPRDLYYGIYAVAVAGFFLAWARGTGQSVPAMLRRHLRAAVIIGVLVAGLLGLVVTQTAPATPGPGGLQLGLAVLWRGIVYGAADGLLLSVFPILAVYAATAGSRARRHYSGRLLIGAAALLASVMMTAVYHLGYQDFRSAKLAKPVIGDLIWSVPTLVTLNPAGSVIAHAGLHVTAVLHAFDTDTYLPPHR